jgi:hypothetical protein
MEWDINPLRAAAAVDDGGGADDRRSGRAREIDRLLRRTACRDDVLDHEDSVTTRNGKSSPQRQRAVLPLGKNRSNAKRTANLLPDDDAAKRRRQHHVRRERAHAFGNRSSTRLGFGGVLQHQRTLQVTRAVESRRQPEVAVKQRTYASKPIQNGIRSNVSGCHNVIIRSYICHRGTS